MNLILMNYMTILTHGLFLLAGPAGIAFLIRGMRGRGRGMSRAAESASTT